MNIWDKQLDLIKKIKNEQCYKCYIELLKDYEPLIISLGLSFKRKYRQTPIELEDIKNVMSFYFYKLILDYDSSRQKEFPSYIKEFLYYRTSTWIKHYITLNHQVMNYYEESHIHERTQKIDRLNINSDILEPENTPTLSKKEIRIINFIKDGYTMKEISTVMDINLKTLYASKNRALDKIKENFN